MKIAVRGGHNFTVPGARGIIDETTEDRKVKDAVIKYLRAAGHTVLDVTSPDSCSTISSDLVYGVNKANNWGADLFLSFHFNNCYNTYNGALGSETCVYNYMDTAQRIVDALGKLGFKNRGQIIRKGLYELRESKMPSIIIETCFVEATEDVKLYRRLGVDAIAKAISEAVCNKSISGVIKEEPTTSQNTTNSGKKLWEVSISGDIVKQLQQAINNQKFGNVKVDGYFGEDTLKACPLVKEGASGEFTRIIQTRLKALGYNINIDKAFGPATKNAVIALQKKTNQSADGIVGQNTWKALFKK